MSESDRWPWKPQSCCGPSSALTVAQLRTRWEELGDAVPILVVRDHSVAYWAQDADVYVARGGLVVARLYAPFAKTSQPAPGTVWPRALTTGEPTYPPIPAVTDLRLPGQPA